MAVDAGGAPPIEPPVVPEVEGQDGQPQPLPDTTTLREHENLFGDAPQLPLEAEGEPEATPTKGKPHRSRGSRAGAEDVPRIQKLTKELRSTQETLAARDARLAELERQVSTRVHPASAEARTPLPAPAPAAPPGFTEKEPQQQDFENEADPYLAYTRALARYDRRKEAYEAREQEQVAQWETQQQEQQQQLIAHRQGIYRGYQEKVVEFVKQSPEFEEAIEGFKDQPVTDLLVESLLLEGPELVYALTRSPWIYDQALLATSGRPVTPELVQSTRRWLRNAVSSGVQAVNTGAAVPPRVVQPPPRPATPVRTGPVISADQPPDTEKSSLRDHERYWHDPEKGGGRRR